MAIKALFPPVGSDYQGGTSNGSVYRLTFAAAHLKDSYAMVVEFLKEEGFSDLPLPQTASELERFRYPSSESQLSMFATRGYWHYPVKIMFSEDRRRKNWLILEIFNVETEGQLLRFYGV